MLQHPPGGSPAYFVNASDVGTASMITMTKDWIRNSNCPEGSVWLGHSHLLLFSKSEGSKTNPDFQTQRRVKDELLQVVLESAGTGVRNRHCCLFWEFAPAHGTNSHCPELGEDLQGFRGRQRIPCHLRPSEDHSILPTWILRKNSWKSVFITAVPSFRAGTCFPDTSISQGQMHGGDNAK